MNKLFTFGCSYTFGAGLRNPKKDCWPVVLSSYINYSSINMAKSGASNDYIVDSILKNLNQITSNDLVIVMMTWPNRKLIYDYDLNEIKNIHPNSDTKTAKNFYKHIHHEYLGILNFFQNYNAIQHLLRNKNFYITFTDIKFILKQQQYNLKITKDDNVIIPPDLAFSNLLVDGSNDDCHPDEQGHIKIANFLFEHITV